MKVKWRDTLPGEKFFGGRGCLIPFRFDAKKPTEPQRALDPNDSLHASIDGLVSGLTPEEKVKFLDKVFPLKERDG